MKSGNNPVITIIGTAQYHLIEGVLEKMYSQGFERIHAVKLDGMESQLTSFNVMFLDESLRASEGNFESRYLKALTAGNRTLMIFTIYGPERLDQLIQNRQNINNQLKKTNPDQYNLVLNVQEAHAQLDEALLEKKLIAEELKSKSHYLAHLLKRTAKEGDLPFNDVAMIKRFYKTEYEILPMWYKRFGHIIKVVMGKRSFRSLFDDNVQKYKE
jgi:hypothetical protein